MIHKEPPPSKIGLFPPQIASGKKKFVVNKQNESGVGMLMNLRKIANHPLLVRHHFDDSQLRTMAKILKRDPSHKDARESYIIEDLSVMSDFDIHKTCLAYRVKEKRSTFLFQNEV